ncbi:sigma-w pathway protein ysdB [Geomicrobium sp. JSM 1781026]|uniref:hypothetical protein n=1 Tax=unclassified Geomicrobium TaxID=2628951 RepID=UPI00045F3FB9|nr:hypothetical protein [Geomicrobium sp. JCM 19039]GAK12506.1 hypothetical protein JCM19039_2288 [Geomicrobium sp. JCM 19039]
MNVIFFLFIAIAFFILVYSAVRYIRDPKHQLEKAHNKQQLYLYDHQQDARKNFLITYKGVMFEGEKYIGTTDDGFEVVRISLDPKRIENIEGLHFEDFQFIEAEITDVYPHATIQWRSPVKQLMNKKKKDQVEASH